MNKNDTNKQKESRNENNEAQKMKNSENLRKKKDKDLPWWVELLFVQIGLPDKLLIRFLNTKKKAKELFKNDKKSLITIFFMISIFAYFYPVIKHSKSKLNCEANATKYIINNKNILGINKSELKMLSTNFCYGGEEIYEFENLKN